ncbi:unnamed protein product [Protopolystoma xenopodis]|uniref:Uncharacterized protein n=1 Tax=Protopolystoma xenopodis TaxID=117903 RepID=A0A3S5B4K5_9PLAT|nr:unnamed protein product [Protopolystoma xenopodis]
MLYSRPVKPHVHASNLVGGTEEAMRDELETGPESVWRRRQSKVFCVIRCRLNLPIVLSSLPA